MVKKINAGSMDDLVSRSKMKSFQEKAKKLLDPTVTKYYVARSNGHNVFKFMNPDSLVFFEEAQAQSWAKHYNDYPDKRTRSNHYFVVATKQPAPFDLVKK